MLKYKALNKINRLIFALAILTVSLISCEKMIDVDTPDNQMVSADVYKDSVTAQAAVNGMYSIMYNGNAQVSTTLYGSNITLFATRSADELVSSDAEDFFFNNSLLPNNSNVATIWDTSYQIIYSANSVITGMETSNLSPALKKQLIAEAKFIRAFCHFTLVNFFGPVPIITSTDVNLNKGLGRAPVTEVYAQVISDLKDAQGSLAADYSWSAALRTRANKWAATALLARVYLYNNNYAMAEEESAKVIAQSSLYSLPAKLSDVFLKGSTEAIWQFNTNTNGYTFLGKNLLPISAVSNPAYTVTQTLLDAFEKGTVPLDDDDRDTVWIKRSTSASPVPYVSKYISNVASANTEFDIVLRLAEQYLIRAEARAQQGKLEGCITDLNLIRTRAGLHGTLAQTKDQLLLAVAHERQVEMFAEYAHRWFDLKRTDRANAVLAPIKGAAWATTDQLYPIPAAQLINNINLKQNSGY